MQDFSFGKIKAQEIKKEPYTLYRKDQQREEPPERAVIRDFEYFRSMYPERLKALQVEVEKVCDEMDYKGSPMYDEFPDRVLMEQMRKKVEEQAEQTKEAGQESLTETAFQAEAETYLPEQTERQGYREWEMNELPAVQAEETRGDFRTPCCPWGAPPPPPWRPVPPPRPWNPCPWGMSCPWRPVPPLPPQRPWNPSRPWERPGLRREEMASEPRIQSADVIDVLLFNEMQRRRCGRGNCG